MPLFLVYRLKHPCFEAQGVLCLDLGRYSGHSTVDDAVKYSLTKREVVMFEEIRKGLLSGFGAVFLTKDKVEELCHKMVDEAKLSKEDAQKLKEELISTGEKHWKQTEQALTEGLKKAFHNIDVAKASELNKLEKRIEQMETRLTAIERTSGPRDGSQY
jgi:polyhydroxyalkanoate synthesis regulator phasin